MNSVSCEGFAMFSDAKYFRFNTLAVSRGRLIAGAADIRAFAMPLMPSISCVSGLIISTTRMKNAHVRSFPKVP
eukprot:794791-Pyramimonas_sp.AAC.1